MFLNPLRLLLLLTGRSKRVQLTAAGAAAAAVIVPIVQAALISPQQVLGHLGAVLRVTDVGLVDKTKKKTSEGDPVSSYWGGSSNADVAKLLNYMFCLGIPWVIEVL